MKYENFLYLLLVCGMSQMMVCIDKLTSKQALLIDRLDQINKQIRVMEQKLASEIDQNSKYRWVDLNLSKNTDQLTKQVLKILPQFNIFALKQSDQQVVEVNTTCKINTLSNLSKWNYYSSFGQFFLLVTDFSSKTLSIYSSECDFLVQISDLLIFHLFEEEKDISNNKVLSNDIETQILYAINQNNQLIAIDLKYIKQKAKNNLLNQKIHKLIPSNQPKLYRVLNSKLIQSHEKIQIIGVMLKTVNHQSQTRSKQSRNSASHRQKSLFIAFDSSEIKVFDEQGKLKISMKDSSLINDLQVEQTIVNLSFDQSNDKAIQFVNIHPHPILVERNWIYFVDIGKFSRQRWNCPFIPKVKKIFVQNYLQSEVYILTDQKIYRINVKPNDSKDMVKKNCQILKKISYYNPQIKNKKPQHIIFSAYKNLIFLDSLVYNMTSGIFMTVKSVNSLQINPQNTNLASNCQQFSISLLPNIQSSKKTPLKKSMAMIFHCGHQSHQSLHILKITHTRSESSALVYIFIGFMMVIFFAVKCFKSTNSNYEKQLLFPFTIHNQETQIRKEHYQELEKYIDSVKKAQTQKQIKTDLDYQQHKRQGYRKEDHKKEKQSSKKQPSKRQSSKSQKDFKIKQSNKTKIKSKDS